MFSSIQKWGNSQGIRLPKSILETALLKENEKVEIIADKGQIIIKKATLTKHKTIQERFSGYNGDYKCTEFDWGKPVGKEVW
jgi:antitoxin MazE